MNIILENTDNAFERMSDSIVRKSLKFDKPNNTISRNPK